MKGMTWKMWRINTAVAMGLFALGIVFLIFFGSCAKDGFTERSCHTAVIKAIVFCALGIVSLATQYILLLGSTSQRRVMLGVAILFALLAILSLCFFPGVCADSTMPCNFTQAIVITVMVVTIALCLILEMAANTHEI